MLLLPEVCRMIKCLSTSKYTMWKIAPHWCMLGNFFWPYREGKDVRSWQNRWLLLDWANSTKRDAPFCQTNSYQLNIPLTPQWSVVFPPQRCLLFSFAQSVKVANVGSFWWWAFLRLSFLPVSFGSFPAMETGISQLQTALALVLHSVHQPHIRCTLCMISLHNFSFAAPHGTAHGTRAHHRPFRWTFPPAWQEQTWSVWGLHVIQRLLEVQSDVVQWHWL